MHLVLVPNPEVGERYDGYSPTLPLGLLSLATVLSRSNSVSTRIVNAREVDFHTPEYIADTLLSMNPNVVGFSTMCNTYPHILRVAKLLKQSRPDVTVVLGGPHASTVGKETLNAFGYIDFALAGECERSINDFVNFLSNPNLGPTSVPGLIFRNCGAATQPTPSYPMLPIDELPTIDYGLIDLSDYTDIPLDVGRGCPFACTFCATNVHWEQRYRLRNVEQVTKTISDLKNTHGVNSFVFVHDNFTAAPKRVRAFCESIIESGIEFKWRCSARPDSVDAALIDLMHKAGCQSIFMGIETGSARIQNLCKKRVKLDRVEPAVKRLTEIGINLTASFIVGFPYEELDDIEQTIQMMLSIHLQSAAKTDLQFHLLSPIPGATLISEANVQIELDEFTSDVSGIGLLDSEAWTMIRDIGSPIFESFYHYSNPSVTRPHVLALRSGWFTVFTHLPYTALALAVARRNLGFKVSTIFNASDVQAITNREASVRIDCARHCLQNFLSELEPATGVMIQDVLKFESEIFHLRRAGKGESLVQTEFDVFAWINGVLDGSEEIEYPKHESCRLIISALDGEIGIAYMH